MGISWDVVGDWVGEKHFGKLATLFVASHLFNKAAEQIRGSDVTLDPIQASIDAYNTYSQEEDKKMGLLKGAGRRGGEFLSNIPVAQNFAAAYPEFGFNVGDTKMPTRSEFFGEGDPTRFGSGLLLTKGIQDPLYKIIPPFGGQQLKRTIEGQKTTNRGFSESKTGRVRFPIENTPLRNLQRATFGEFSTPEARQYFDTKASVLGEKQSETLKSLSPEKGKEYYQNIIQKRGLENEKEALKKKLESQKVNLNQVQTPTKSSQITTGSNIPVYRYLDDKGNMQTIDLSKPLTQPEKTGQSELDKKKVSKFKGEITSRINDIVKLNEEKQISDSEAEKLIKELKLQSTKLSGPKKVSFKSLKAPKLPKIKISKGKMPKIKLAKLKTKSYKFKPITIKRSRVVKLRKIA